MNYYHHPYVSNSKLSQLKADLSATDARDLKEAWRCGTLLDAYITAPKTIDIYAGTVTTDGGVYNYTGAEMKKGSDMRMSFFIDPVCRQLHEASNLQEEVYNHGVEFGDLAIGCKCKCDGRLKQARWPWDLKRTICRSQGAFEDVFTSFDYDRQAYFYMQVCEASRMLFIGVSDERPYPIYKIMIMKGDARYESGREKTMELITKFDFLCQ